MSDQQESDVVTAWINHAHSDLQLGRAALRTKGVLPEDACFHAQQCAEKARKALARASIVLVWVEAKIV